MNDPKTPTLTELREAQVKNLPTSLLSSCQYAFAADHRIISMAVETQVGRVTLTLAEVLAELATRPSSLPRKGPR